MTDTPRGAILQRDKQTYAIKPRTPVGLVSPELLDRISQVVKKYKIPMLKITSGQRLFLVGMKADEVDAIWQELKVDGGPAVQFCVHYVQACPGNSFCTFGVQDSLELGLKLEKMFVDIGKETPAKMKMGISGCPLCCSESYVRDFGAFGRKNGWTVIFGGNSGGRPRIGDVLAENLTVDQVLELARRCLSFYREHGKKKERTARFVDRMGIEAVKQAVLPGL